jgi:hypothetical protein
MDKVRKNNFTQSCVVFQLHCRTICRLWNQSSWKQKFFSQFYFRHANTGSATNVSTRSDLQSLYPPPYCGSQCSLFFIVCSLSYMWNNFYPSCTPKFLQEFPFMSGGRGSQVAGCSPFINSNHSQDTCWRVDMRATAATGTLSRTFTLATSRCLWDGQRGFKSRQRLLSSTPHSER